MEITETTLSVVWLCQLFGIAPYEIVRNKTNRIVNLKLSRAMCIYSAIFMIICSVSSNYGLLYDLYSGHALRYLIFVASVVYRENIFITNPDLSSELILCIRLDSRSPFLYLGRYSTMEVVV